VRVVAVVAVVTVGVYVGRRGVAQLLIPGRRLTASMSCSVSVARRNKKVMVRVAGGGLIADTCIHQVT
jgi:hypothetical protein